MHNKLTLYKINCVNDTVTYEYAVEGDWSLFFNTQERFFIKYPMNIESVPDSVLAVPFLANFLPLVWLFDAVALLPELDSDFYSELSNLKKGYMNMYPMLDFKGKVQVGTVKENHLENATASSIFFSGGVDAYTTLLRHIDEKPLLVTIWGADIDIYNTDGWEKLRRGIIGAAEDFNLEFVEIKSSLKRVIDEPGLTLSELIKPTNEGWWHGFQHGMAIISHMAPLAYLKGIKYSYIASSNPAYAKGTYTCASDPTIDNYMCFCGCTTIHDGYELDRQQKIKYIIQEKEKHKYSIQLHVCWESDSGQNCCMCEKCYRTILEIVAEGADPKDYGFDWSKSNIKQMRILLKDRVVLPKFYIDTYYSKSQTAMKNNIDQIKDANEYKWFLNMDMTKFNDYPMKKIRRTWLWTNVRKIYKTIKGE